MDPLFRSRIQIGEMRRTLRPDVAPCYAGDGAPIRAGMGGETRDDSLSSTAAEINVTFFVNVRINENELANISSTYFM